ncbi:unnamed protein product [Psylliodes chrysocephalus]|uniref:Uncharacterized protein n=1 Tax=Psylliodes chrysocephalus TaxID=3402493 RepID=A0A9P0D159_9CUCU|nr:unnamed protein product [Psylliodes chrysocephala]
MSEVQFEPITTQLSELPETDLSTNQQFLYQSSAISIGIIPDNLANKNPGKLSHACWLTTANRLLRLYVATDNLSDNLKYITTTILRIYAPMCFQIKTKPKLHYGIINFWHTIKASREFPNNISKRFLE